MNKKVSIIIPIFNVEKYIDECLASVIVQKIGNIDFEDAFEVILINDGSFDTSVSIAQRYVDNFKNIKILHQNNCGQSVARNKAIDIATGDYIFFLDSDDLLPPNAIAPLYDLALRTHSDVIISMGKSFNKKRSWFIEEHAEVACANFRKVKFFHKAILVKSPAPWAKLYKRDFVVRNEIKFPTGIKLAEDWVFVLNCLYKSNHISTTSHISYLYRGRDDELNPSCTQIVNEKVFSDLLKVYDLANQIPLPEKQIFLSKIFILKGILYRIFKFSQDNSLKDVLNIYKMLSVFFIEKIGLDVLKVFSPERRIFLFLIYYKYYSEAYRYANGELRATCLKKAIFLKNEVMVSDYNNLKNKNRFKKKKKFQLNYLNRVVKRNIFKFKYELSKILSNIYYKDKNIVLIGERGGETCNDCGYYLFSNRLKENVSYDYYFVTKNKNIEKIDNNRNVLIYGGLKHFMAFHAAKKYVFTDSMRDVFYNWQEVYKEHSTKERIFLQHGIFALNRAKGYYDRNSMLRRNELPNKFIVSSEKESLLVQEQFGFRADEVAVTGLSRFDTLFDKSNDKDKRILVLFTWRDWLLNSSNNKLMSSDYVLKMLEILKSSEIMTALREHKISLDLCLHHKVSKLLKNQLKSLEHVNVYDMNDDSVQDLISKANLMVTDYSSASFDMLYQKKPVIYYWFDFQRFFASRGGILIDIDKDMPGEICFNYKEFVNVLLDYMNQGLKIDDKYIGVINEYFSYKDNMNSKRIFSVIEEEC